jgi:hypothetical protein
MVSPHTTLAEIADGEQRYYAFLGTGGGPQQRFGSRDPANSETIEFRETVLARGFAELLERPSTCSPSRARRSARATTCTTAVERDDMLFSVLSTEKTNRKQAQALQTIAEAPLYFLNLWMPACQLMLLAAEGRGLVAGHAPVRQRPEIGIQVAGLPGEWFTRRRRRAGAVHEGRARNPQHPPATGDSGVIDAFGLGGQGLRHAPSLLSAFHEWLPAGDDARARSMLAGTHPILETPFGLDAAAVARGGRPPLLSTGMVSADGRGLLGRGICTVPIGPFAAAAARLKS